MSTEYGEPWRDCQAGGDDGCVCGMVWDNTGDIVVARTGRYSEPWDPNPDAVPRNAARIAACVNALAGVPNPVAELTRLRNIETVVERFLTAFTAPHEPPESTP